MPFDNFFFLFFLFSFKENGVSLFGIFFCCMVVYCMLFVSVITPCKLQMLTHVTVKYIYLALPSKTMNFFCRLKASLLECVSGRQPTVLLTSYEDILKKDPTCSHSLAELIRLYKNG